MAQYTNPKKKKNNDIAPIRSDVGLFQRADNWNDVDNFWEGVGAFGETALASTADLGVNVVKGAGRLVEGVTDLFGHGIAGLADLLGFDEWSDEFRGYVNDSWVDNLASPADEFLDEYSIFGQTGDAIGEGIGQVASLIVTGGALGAARLSTAGISAATTALMGASSMGSGMSEAYNAGANDKQAFFYGIMKGAIDAGSELIFGGLGKTVNALGISRGLSSLDDIVAKKLSSGISNQFFKNVVQWGVKSSAEGLEEVLAGIGTIAAKKLTYMSDEELGKLIKDENLFQQFIVGAVSAGVTQSGLIPGMKKGSLAETTKKGQDFVSGLTASEQKVADNLFEKAVKQKEADGKKLSGFEKNKIFDSIVEQMESGDIDVETIEDILKEDVYKDNKAKLDEEDALFKEYEELGKKKASNISLAEETRYKELHDKTKELTFRKDLDSRMSEEVYNRVKDSRLASSYADAARRGDAFQADINEYDEAERATIQSAIDAGFLNNTNKTRRFVNWIAKIAAKTGIKVDFTTNEKLKQSGFAIDGKTINGYKTKDGIGINMQSKKVLETVVGHEITHVLEGTELYNEMQKILYDYADSKGELSTRRKAIENLYKGMKADIDSELTAELVGDYLFADQEFINRLANDNRNLFQKMWDEVKYMWSQAHPSSPEAQKLEQLKRVFEKAYNASERATTTNQETKYSLGEIVGESGTNYGIGVYLDSTLLTDLTEDERVQMVKEYVKELGGKVFTAYDGDNNAVDVHIVESNRKFKNKSGKRVPVNKDLSNKQIKFKTKQEAIALVDELITTAKYENNLPSLYSHDWVDNYGKNNWEYWKTYIQDKENTIWEAKLNIATTADGEKILYDINPIKKVEQSITLDTSTTNPIITQKSDLSSGFEKNSAKNDISVLEGGSVTKFSLSTWTPETQKRVKNDLVKSGFDSAQVDKWIADTNSVAAVIAADKDRLDFEAADNQVMLKDNQEYIKTLDASTLCAKRLVYQGTFDAIQHRLPNTVLTSDDLIDLLNMMKEKGVQTPCGVCYVESRRRHLGKFAKEWLDGYQGEYKPNLDEVTTSDGLEALRKSHPQTYKDFVDAMNKKGSSNPKVVQLRTEYRNEIMSLTPAQIRKIEAIGGLRVQSFSDFETPHMLDMMQAVMDMSAKGLHSQAYTKVPNFAWVFGDTGIKINLSLIAEGDGFDADGNLAFSSTEGMSIDDAMALRDAYSSNVGTIIVGANDKHILACMADDRIDFIIPFHRSGWGKNELDMMGMSSYTDYTYGQKEHDLATGKGVANLYPPDYWDYSVSGKENAEKYLNLCAKLGREPKFSQFLVNNGDGSYSLQPDGSTDGYWKTLIDFKMYDNNGVGAAQQTVQPNFNMDEAYRVLNEYEGGANKLPVANEVVDEFVAKKQGVQFSVSEDSETTPRDVYFSRIDEVYDKLKGESSGKPHTVDGYTFFLHRNDFDESAYISITTPDGKKLRQIVDGGNLWKNARLWREAAKMVANHENPNVATATTQEEAGEYSEIEGKREETKKTFKEKVSDTKNLGRKAVGYLVDKYQPIENLALKTGNRELDAKANTMRTSERAAQHFIGNGADGVRAINDLRQEVEASGLENEFEEYMYDLLTTDRMSLEERAKPIIKKLGDKFKNMKLYQIKALAKKEITQKTTETSAQYIRDAREYLRAISARNKPVRGDFYTADIARAHATELEQKYPQFKQWAEDVYANTNFMLNKLVADGELSQEAADRFRELYPHYVPIRRVNKDGKAVDVPLYSNRTGVDAPIKGATGGDGKIGYLFETLAMRAEQTFLAGAKNRFGIELKNTLKANTTDAEVDVEDIFEEVDTHEDRLKAGEDGQAPTFTVFENGKRVTFEIPEDIYDALKPTDEFWKQTFAVPNAITKFQRGVLTEYNPFFMARNAVKDFQDVLINSQHAKETYKNFPEAMRQLYAYEHGGEDAQYAKEYFENGAEDLTYFDGKEKLFDSKNTENPWAKEKNSEAKKIIGFIPSKISQASSFVERVPRLAEYIASRKAGASIDVAMLDAARVTTNFAAGGDVTKFANRNGATFLNASVQGAAQAVRNIREAKAQGLKGMLKLGAKVAIAGIPYLIVNALLWGDDDEYEELSDYIKENYYIVAKYGDGQFVRIPKGRMAAVIQSAFQQMSNLVTGNDEVDFERFGELLVENIAPNNPLENNIFAPIMNVAENKTWYGDDLVPQRLQDLPAGEQSDETTDAISKWLGETINVSPYKLNYLLDQYSGVFGDMFLPAMTPQAEGGNSTLLGGMIAPITDQFTTDSTMKNQNVSDFYDTLDDLTASAKSKHATDGDVLRYKYMNAVNSDISALYKQKREIQNSSLSNSVKYERVREIQRQIDELAKQALAAYNGISVRGNTATVGGYQFKKNKKGEWEKVRESSSSSNWSNDLFDWMSGFSNNFDIPDFNLD